ncbi:hypothetical protein RJ640_008178 [Escallonia rubra]|uniref:Cytochrome P450 n=1 Tax=Escallonia rubra TaxID=112253 RepID=A0AA88S4D2_9ASTE|nr:hypothetical protein RJ640_008178 [Escallonia rubra]
MKYLAELPYVYHEVLRVWSSISVEDDPLDISSDALTLGVKRVTLGPRPAPPRLFAKTVSGRRIINMRYSWNVASEILGLHAPAPRIFRKAITNFTCAGYRIPKGCNVREKGPAPYTFVPFGEGPLMCPGNEYVHLAILVSIHNVVLKFKGVKFIPGEKVLKDSFSIPAHELPVYLHRHS